MATHAIRVTQVFRVERWITVKVEADTYEDAEVKLIEGDIELPSAADPAWDEMWQLENEEYIKPHSWE